MLYKGSGIFQEKQLHKLTIYKRLCQSLRTITPEFMPDTTAVKFPIAVYCWVSLVGQDAEDTGEGGRQGASLTELKDQYENKLLSECSKCYGVVTELGRPIKSQIWGLQDG